VVSVLGRLTGLRLAPAPGLCECEWTEQSLVTHLSPLLSSFFFPIRSLSIPQHEPDSLSKMSPRFFYLLRRIDYDIRVLLRLLGGLSNL